MEKYLQEILLEVNTIIVPGLGALTITNHTTGEIMFMPYLKYDDGKLATFIAEKSGMTLEEAKSLISNKVQEILAAVQAGNNFNLAGLGTFSNDSSGDLQFTFCVTAATENIQESSASSTPAVEEMPVQSEIVGAPADETAPEVELAKEFTPFSAPLEEKIEEVSIQKEEIASPVEQVIVEEQSVSIVVEESEELTVQDQDITEEIPLADLPKEKKKGLFSFLRKSKKVVVEAPTEQTSEEIVEELSEEKQEEEVAAVEAEPIISDEPTISFEEPKVIEPQAIEINDAAIEISTEEEVVEQTSSEKNGVSNESEDLVELELELDAYEAPKKKKRGLVFWLLMVLILAVLGGGGYFGVNYFLHPKETAHEGEGKEDVEKIVEELSSDKTKPAAASGEEEAMVESPSEEPKQVAEEEESQAVEPTKTVSHSTGSNGAFAIILGSFGARANADRYVDRLKSEGKSGASVIEKEGKYQVSFGSYSSKAEAAAELASAKDYSPNAWILTK